jgi:DNA-binding transcriptional LysR family regulator
VGAVPPWTLPPSTGLATGGTARTLRIYTLGMAAKKLIAPRLGRSHRAHPDVALDIVIDDALSDIITGRFDAAIRIGERLEKDTIALRLTPDVELLALASVDYLARRGEPRIPARAAAGSITGRRARSSRWRWRGR